MQRVLAGVVLAAILGGVAGCADPYYGYRYRTSTYSYPPYYYYEGTRVIEVRQHPRYGWVYPNNTPVPEKWHRHIHHYTG